MLANLRQLFKAPTADPDQSISPALATAAIMFEVSWADHDIGNSELEAIGTHLNRLFPEEGLALQPLIDDAQTRLEDSVGVHPYTRFLNETLSEPEKFRVLVALWNIALADTYLDKFEEHSIRQIADLLNLSHNRFIEAKLLAKAQEG